MDRRRNVMRIETYFIDVDGTLTDGKIYYSQQGDEVKAFSIKDGLILSRLKQLGSEIVVITGRESKIVEKRMKELGITEVYQDVSDKALFLNKYINEKKLNKDYTCYIGDDLNDLAAMKLAGKRACPVDACEEIREFADYISKKKGGDGAIRDIMEHFLKESNDWDQVLSTYD